MYYLFFLLTLPLLAWIEPIADAQWGLLIESIDGEVLIEHQSTKNFVPASVTKLFTTALALEHLGADRQFHTRAFFSEGNLCLKGGGDPSLSRADLAHLARQIYEGGIRQLDQIIGDQSLFEGTSWPNDWCLGDLNWYYAPPISALSCDENRFLISLSNGALETQWAPLNLVIEWHPSETLSFKRNGMTNQLVVTGSEGEQWLAVMNPALNTTAILREELIALGIECGPASLQEVETATWRQVGEIASPPVVQLLHYMNETSQNLYAQLLWLHVKKEAPEIPYTFMRDGCGASRRHYVSPREIVDLLQAHDLEDLVPPIAPSLRAKWGGMAGISALAGYALTRSEREVVFCIICNNAHMSAPDLREIVKPALLKELNQL